MPELATETLAWLGFAAFVAGYVDSIAGGGGLITVPTLLLTGYSPAAALGTNKLQGLFGSGSATLAYAAKGHVDLREQGAAALLAFIGGIIGASLVSFVPADWLRLVLPFLLVAIALFFLLGRKPADQDRTRRMAPLAFTLSVVPMLGFYDGIFGPGAGSFYMLAFVFLAGYGLLKATAHTKLLNFASNAGGFLAFAIAGVVDWKVGLIMGLAQFFGARLGAGLAIRHGARVIRPLLVLVCLALAIRLLMDDAHPLRVWLGV